ncbi:MAG: 1-(5-phosphoribosyl)-5-[(5-phosphoribosylamino)methylideneamino]imidazole-4-carboxamide isomerase [Leptospirales bacterium]|nr:1-(5-phosphoribosyl)-5-[(5-phosphoribosylamino)methylideneamino]imidazole-4-carboxamide isomerase [Leptospirales bacterium]
MSYRFQVIPAIDILDGKVVRLHQGDYGQTRDYRRDPAEQLRQFVEQGAELIHLVDLNAARDGDRAVNREKIGATLQAARECKVRVELGGGLRDLSSIEAMLQLGVDRCILGTAAVKQPELVRSAVDQFGAEHIVVGVDALDGQVRVSGWEESSGVSVSQFLAQLEVQGCTEVIFTDISRDGALAGPALSALEAVLEWSGMRIVASGGISALSDLQTLIDLRHPRLVGVITGKAIYEGKLDLAEALRLASAV